MAFSVFSIAALLGPDVVEAKRPPDDEKEEQLVPAHPANLDELFDRVREFMSWKTIYIVFSLCLAIGLAATIAHHPRHRAASLEEAEQPKIYLMYAVAGALIGQICGESRTMAYVIFGLGGLFRFRTDVGPAKDTGRLILVTLVGVLCGLLQFVAALVATGIGWLLIFFHEGRTAYRVVIKGIESALLGQAAEAYHAVLVENGLIVMSQKKNFVKGQVAFVFRAPGKFDRDALEELFKDIPPKLHGSPDWESS